MTSRTDALMTLIESARGPRPKSLASEEAEDVLNIALSLLVELSVSNDRIDRLERIVADLSGRSVADLRETLFDTAATEERQEAMEALLIRVMRVILDPRGR